MLWQCCADTLVMFGGQPIFTYLFTTQSARFGGSRFGCLLIVVINMAAAAINLRDLHLATATEADCRQWLRGRRLLAANMQCPKCYTMMQERDYSRVLDGRIWRCPPKQCRTIVSLRKGSFFENSNLPLTKLIDLIYYWSINLSNTDAEHEVTNVAVVSYAYNILHTLRFRRQQVLKTLSMYVVCSSV